MMEFFTKNNQLLKAINYFHKKPSSEMLNRVLNTLLFTGDDWWSSTVLRKKRLATIYCNCAQRNWRKTKLYKYFLLRNLINEFKKHRG